MVTVKINVKSHLSEYAHGKYNNCHDGAVSFPDREDIYHVIYDLLEKRPSNSVDTGNLEIVLPTRHVGKSPDSYNYLGVRSQRIIGAKLETMFWRDLHLLIDENKHLYGIQYIESVVYFMRKYGIQSITEDALLKNYYRWRDKVRKKKARRQYLKS